MDIWEAGDHPQCMLGAVMAMTQKYTLEPEQITDFETMPLTELRKQIRNTLAANIEDWGGPEEEADAMLDAYDRRLIEHEQDEQAADDRDVRRRMNET